MSLSLIKPDHLVVLARTLDEGIQYVADTLRAAPVPVGATPEMGTHSARLALWDGLYLDVVAPDPAAEINATASRAAAPAPASRWYGMDSAAIRLRAAHGPFLAHWVARVERPRKLEHWARQYPRRIGPVRAVSHARRAAMATLETDGGFPSWRGAGDGLLPTLVQWDDASHPTETLPETGIALKALHGFHPSPELIGEQLRWLGLAPMLSVEPTLVEPTLFAEFDTPSGTRTLK